MSILKITLITICSFWSVYVNAKITIMTEDFAPFGYYDAQGKLTGIGVELVQAITEKLNVDSNIQVLPWSRAIKKLELLPNRALFCVARTPARNDKFEWVGPILSDGVYLYHTNDFDSSKDTIQSAKLWKNIAVTANYPEHQVLTELGFDNLWITNQPQENIRLLIYNRVTAMVAGEFAMPSLLKSLEMDGTDVVRSEISLFDIELYIAFSKGTDPQVLRKWQNALEELKSSPQYYQIRQRYTVPTQ